MPNTPHECIIGLYFGYAHHDLVTAGELIQTTKVYWQTQQLADSMRWVPKWHNRLGYSPDEYFDRRKETDLKRFDFCPECGKKINWKKLREEYIT